jgi:hypothetical protein
VFIGHVSTGGYGPFKIGRGPRRITGGLLGTAAAYDGVWSFDHFQGGETDSAQGWTFVQPAHSSIGPSDLDDNLRPWFGLDGGNRANHRPVQGRTFGVTGIWHADNGSQLTSSVGGSNPVAPGWTPIAGTRSAWCGIRSHGDLTAVDATGTGNPINATLADFNGNNSGRQFGSLRTQGTDHNFPGYGSQWDQMFYRDVTLPANLAAGQNLNVAFKYTTNMSVGFDATHASQAGYFYYDPIKIAAADGNYISINSAVNPPVDSFMVYVGIPVDNSFVLSTGVSSTVFDTQRRWFSEVIRTQNVGGAPGSAPYKQLVSATGVQGTTGAPILVNQALASTVINPILDQDGGAGNGGRVRIVFRVKTNRGFDDENNGNSGFSSGGAGAAIVDDVVISGPSGTLLNDGFEGTNGGFDNTTALNAGSFWKSTGKPPATWTHIHDLDDGLPFQDPCGAITAPVRLCNMGNNVITPGNHDDQDKPGGTFGTNFQDALKWSVSPTINMVSPGVGSYNGMGIDAEIAGRGNLVLFAEQLWNGYDYDEGTGNGWRIGWQSYPSTQPNGVRCWGEMRKPPLFSSTGGIRGCFGGDINAFQDEAYSSGMIFTTNPSGKPDSVRCYIESMSRCFTLPLTGATCSPVSGASAGTFFDNISIAFITAAPPPSLGFLLGTSFQDCFPVNGLNRATNAFGLAYDTLAARIQTGFNNAPNRNNDVSGPDAREVIAGDSSLVDAPGANIRVDMVFRILPGVGNYVTLGTKASGVARRPDVSPRVAATAADAANAGLSAVEKFWGAYLADNGTFGTPGGHGGAWNANVWNSARMDTVENNFFPISGLFNNDATTGLLPGQYMSTLHESEPKYGIIGIPKNRCFLDKNKQPVKVDESQINCAAGTFGGGTITFVQWPPAHYLGNANSGMLQAPEGTGLVTGQTREFTKILPDGQFTPGTHIQYFFRKSNLSTPATFEMVPDTNFIIPNDSPYASFDGHRWLSTSVLPDRWKDGGFGGNGMACMLVVDLGDRRGDEIIWVSMADSIGLTQAPKRGAHNGWRARPDQNIFANVGNDDTIARRDNGGQAGSLFDLYSVIAGESNFPAGRIGSRGAAKNTGTGSFTPNRWSVAGPTETMLNNYKTLMFLGADCSGTTIGPLANQTDNDIGAFTSFLTQPGGSGLPRALMIMGYDMGDVLGTSHSAFLSGHMRATLRTSDYRNLSGVNTDVADLVALAPIVPGGGTFTYGFGNQCFVDNDVFNVETPIPAGQAASRYQNAGAGNPYVSGVYAPDVIGSRPSRSLINGWTLGLFGGGFGTQTTLLNVGVRKYFFDMLTTAFGGLSCQPTGNPVGVGDGTGTGSAFVNFMNLKSSNPMKSGQARIAFGLSKQERVQVYVYDVTGRLMKKVADRTFEAGVEHVVIWDGTNEAGQKVRSGVYFYKLQTPTWTSQKKLAVLAN